jgi:DNA invertase Pin-like site-specific DNA recombinase
MLIGYMRVSTNADRQSIDLQKDALIKAGVDERHLFSDYESGVKEDREGLKNALDFIQKGDCLVVWKLDRLGRSLTDLLGIIKKLKEKGVGFKSLAENIDTTTPQGAVFFHIFGALSQYEHSIMRERIIAGIESAQKRGCKIGRPRKLNAEKLTLIQKALAAGENKAAICRAFQIPRTTLYDYIRRMAGENHSSGLMPQGAVEIKDEHSLCSDAKPATKSDKGV